MLPHFTNGCMSQFPKLFIKHLLCAGTVLNARDMKVNRTLLQTKSLESESHCHCIGVPEFQSPRGKLEVPPTEINRNWGREQLVLQEDEVLGPRGKQDVLSVTEIKKSR